MEVDKQQPVLHVEVPDGPTTTTENGSTESVAVKAEGPGVQGEGAGNLMTGNVKTVEKNIATDTGGNLEKEVIAEGKMPLCVLNVGRLVSDKW